VPLRGLFVRDRDAYFFTTDLAGTPAEVIGSYTGRWNRASTFEEGRAGAAWRLRRPSRAAREIFSGFWLTSVRERAYYCFVT
jgi:hypothetical protein